MLPATTARWCHLAPGPDDSQAALVCGRRTLRRCPQILVITHEPLRKNLSGPVCGRSKSARSLAGTARRHPRDAVSAGNLLRQLHVRRVFLRSAVGPEGPGRAIRSPRGAGVHALAVPVSRRAEGGDCRRPLLPVHHRASRDGQEPPEGDCRLARGTDGIRSGCRGCVERAEHPAGARRLLPVRQRATAGFLDRRVAHGRAGSIRGRMPRTRRCDR